LGAVYTTPFSTKTGKLFNVFWSVIYTPTAFWGPENAKMLLKSGFKVQVFENITLCWLKNKKHTFVKMVHHAS